MLIRQEIVPIHKISSRFIGQLLKAFKDYQPVLGAANKVIGDRWQTQGVGLFQQK